MLVLATYFFAFFYELVHFTSVSCIMWLIDPRTPNALMVSSLVMKKAKIVTRSLAFLPMAASSFTLGVFMLFILRMLINSNRKDRMS